MKKFFKRLIYIILGGLFLFGLTQGRLADFSFFNYLLWGAWGVFTIVLLIFLGNRQGWWVFFILVGLNSFTLEVNAQSVMGYVDPSTYINVGSKSISRYYQDYCTHVQTAEANNWKGYRPCDADQLEKARELTAQKVNVPPESTDKCTCTSDYDCAVKLMTLCSAYNRRNPENEVHTVLQILSNQQSGCWPCDMATIIFVVIQNLSFSLYDIMVQVALIFLKIIFLGWITFSGLSAVVFQSEGMSFPVRVLQRFIVVMLVYLALSTSGMTMIYNGLLNPVMNMGLGISQEINQLSVSGNKTFSDRIDASVTRTTGIDYCAISNSNPLLTESETVVSGGINFSNNPRGTGPDIVFYNVGYTEEENFATNVNNLLGNTWGAKFLPTSTSGKNNTLLNDSMKSKLLCMTQKFYKQGEPFIVLGQSLVEFSTKDSEPFKFLGVKVFGDFRWPKPFKMWFVGIIFVAVFSVFSFLVAFKIMDIFLRLAFFLVLMPLFVAAIAFPFSRDFAKKGWDFLIHTVLEFVALALALAFIMQILESFLKIDETTLYRAMIANYSEDYGINLLNAVYTDGACRFFFGIIGMCYFGFKILQKMTPLVDSMFGVKGVADKSLIGATMMSQVKHGADLLKSTADLTSHEKIQFKAPDAQKREEIQKLEKEHKKEQIKANDLQDQANTKDIKAKALETKALSAGATNTEKQQAQKARQEAQEAQKLADKQKAKAQELQNKIFIAKQQASALRFPSSQSKFKARRYVDDLMSEAHYGMQRDAEKLEKFGIKTGQVLNKTGIGAVVGVPLIVGTKAVSIAMRAPTKAASMAVHGLTGVVAGGAHSYNWLKNKLTGKK